MESQFKIVLLGEGCVGKTSLVLQYCRKVFNPEHLSTIQAHFLEKHLTLGRERVSLNIWDTAGQERFHALGPIYYRDANGALLVYDITDAASFKKVQSWVKELRKMLGFGVKIAIAGNKIDLERQRAVDKNEAELYAKSVGATHFLTSAKLDKGINELFLALTQSMLAGKKEKQTSTTGRRGRGGLHIPEEDGVAGATNRNTSGGGSRCCS